jgi:ComF family protein
VLKTLGEMLLGGSCFLCRGRAASILCTDCDADLPRLGAELCPRCALASPAGAVCGRCLTQPPAYDATCAALAYAFPADVLIQSLKFRGELALAPLLGGLLSKCLSTENIGCIIPVPLSPARLRARGFNQALEIARSVAAATRARLAPELCERSRETGAQMELPLKERAQNVRGAFRCPTVVSGTIAVLDDVMTTGATLDEIAATLKRAGAARVVNWVVARTPPQFPAGHA